MDSFSPLSVLLLPAMAHAALAFIQALKKGPSQFDDLLGIMMCPVPVDTPVGDVLDISLGSKYKCHTLMLAVTFWRLLLRRLGLLPGFIYLIWLFLALCSNAMEASYAPVLTVLVIAAGLLQITYLVLKIVSNIPSLLLDMHITYRNSNYLIVLLDIAPLSRK